MQQITMMNCHCSDNWQLHTIQCVHIISMVLYLPCEMLFVFCIHLLFRNWQKKKHLQSSSLQVSLWCLEHLLQSKTHPQQLDEDSQNPSSAWSDGNLVGGFSPSHLKKKTQVKLDHFPKVRGDFPKKYLKRTTQINFNRIFHYKPSILGKILWTNGWFVAQ